MDNIYYTTTLYELCDELEAHGCKGVDFQKIKGSIENASVFYDLLQQGGPKLYPYDPEYPHNLDRILMELSLKIKPTELADCVEKLHEERILATRRKANSKKGAYIDLARDSQRWNLVSKLCGEHLEVVRVQRVQNEYISDQYESYKTRMAMKPGFTEVNEQFLFHGTGRTDPRLVCLGTEGFDPRLARHGNYGCGSYFSTTPNYSAKNYSFAPNQSLTEGDSWRYSSGTRDSTCHDNRPRQIVLARVACGNVYDMKNSINQSLTRPPPISPDDPMTLYDSVKGGPFTSRSSEMCMVVVYDKAQAMPDFCVTFRYRSTFEEANLPRRVVVQNMDPVKMMQTLRQRTAQQPMYSTPGVPPPLSIQLPQPIPLVPIMSQQQQRLNHYGSNPNMPRYYHHTRPQPSIENVSNAMAASQLSHARSAQDLNTLLSEPLIETPRHRLTPPPILPCEAKETNTPEPGPTKKRKKGLFNKKSRSDVVHATVEKPSLKFVGQYSSPKSFDFETVKAEAPRAGAEGNSPPMRKKRMTARSKSEVVSKTHEHTPKALSLFKKSSDLQHIVNEERSPSWQQEPRSRARSSSFDGANVIVVNDSNFDNLI
mmetsp:Transcript_30527/g.48848  ORF Transcript_30527/g.48848 Transcript_30527/m.48848 type:complete len:597 (-) Transcript_30527:2265-4055(-)